MISAAADPRHAHESERAEIEIGGFINGERVVVDLEVASRKRLFEQMAKLIAARDDAPEVDAVLCALTKREKLGCTGIGNGIALPHSRIEGVSEPLIAIARLKRAINYEASDGVLVWLAVCLLVPVDANETHLRLLAALAARFKSSGFLAQLKNSRTAADLAAHFKTTPPGTQP